MSTLNLGDSLIMNSDIVVNGGEVKTGATFNGKPVYCQIQKLTGTMNTSVINIIGTTIPNIRDKVYLGGTYVCGWSGQLPYYYNATITGVNRMIAPWWDGNTPKVETYMNTSMGITIYLWCMYTKTTD